MLHAVTNYLNAKRPAATRLASYVGAGYLVGHYITDRLEDVRTRVLQERIARAKYVLHLVYISRHLIVFHTFQFTPEI